MNKRHDHVFGQDRIRRGERRTLLVIALTATMMAIEIAAGIVFGSMALLADGLHMGSHAAALGVAAFAYYYTRKHARNPRFSFGTGKVNPLAGFSSALLLVMFALMMVWESVLRFVHPVQIIFNQAIFVAVIGLIVNAFSVLILGERHHDNEHLHADHPNHHRRDHNLRAAYLHVLADALTSLFAIFALMAGKYFGLIWMDPMMGIVGAILVARWSYGLMKDTTSVLLDQQAPEHIQRQVREVIEKQAGTRITDLHIWSIGPAIYTLAMAIETVEPKSPDHYKQLLPQNLGFVHATVEIHGHK